MDRKHEVREALQKVNPALAGKVQFATGQMSFGFPAGEEPKDHDWRFVGMDLEAGAVSRFQCQRCGHWMSRRETKAGAKSLELTPYSRLCTPWKVSMMPATLAAVSLPSGTGVSTS